MSIGNFFLKQLLKSKMRDIPASEQEKIFTLLDKNPNFFKMIAEKVQKEIEKGKDQQTAVMEVISQHQKELQAMLQSN